MRSCCFFIVFFFIIAQNCFAQTTIYKKIDSCAKHVSGNLGVYAEVIETGQNVSYHGDAHFPMQSVYKFPIAMAVLDAVDHGKLKLDQMVHLAKAEYIPANGHSPIRDEHPEGVDISIRDLIVYSVGESDGSASDALCKAIGGIQTADTYVHHLGVQQMHIAITEKIQVANDPIQYKNWATPKATTELLSIFFKGDKLQESSRTYLLKVMTESSPGKYRLKGLLPKGTMVAHKTGTAGTMKDGLTRATNDAGIITLPNGHHLAITVYISDSHSSQQERELAIAMVAKAIFDYYLHAH